MSNVRTIRKWVSFALAVAVLAAQAIVASESADGPYIVYGESGRLEAWSVATTADGARKEVRPLRAGETFTVPAVNNVPAFKVKLRKPAEIAPDTVSTRATAPLFVVADTHGEYEILVEMLQHQRVVDERLRWSFGRGHLVLLGDVFDRGPNQTEILWLIYQLEAEASKAGGAVHLLIGNHESMVLRDDLRYLNPKYPKTAEVLGVGTYAELFNANSVLGQWLRTKPAVLKINDLLCLHGGISPAVVDRKLTLTDLNETVRAALSGSASANDERADFVMKNLGPLWYRGYFADQKEFPTATPDDINRIREHFGVSRILVGHTIVPTITPLYDGKVIAVQVYPRRDEQSGAASFESLLIRGKDFFRAKPDGSVERLN